MPVPDVRIRTLAEAPLRDGDFVLYWMIATRRSSHSHALDRALELARETGKPLLVLEPLRVGYRWASDRLHAFVIDGMRDQAEAFAAAGVTYLPYLEPKEGDGKGLLEALAARSVAVVTDDFPTFFLPRMLEAAADRLEERGVRLEAVDSNGLYPMYATDRVFARAVDFRRHLHKTLLPHLDAPPNPKPLDGYDLGAATIPKEVAKKWPAAKLDAIDVASFPIDHSVGVAPERGGSASARACLKRFLEQRLARYADARNHPDDDAASGLSPFLHFGHLSIHEVFAALVKREGWKPSKVDTKHVAKREGFWGGSAPFESFVDEAITWRELGYNFCSHRLDYDEYASLPDWAKATLAEHASDPREKLYTLTQLERAQTYDEVWNAAQRELVATGRMHNYLRMLWGKKILEWSPDAEEALARMIELNNKYALDGRNPNSYSGIFWVLGRFDRAWGPERPIYGTIRYMTSESTKRKLHLKHYLARWGERKNGTLFEG
ncbi:MAG: deoxyribodipyrimidine photolyase [Sandaracinus sp.]|nr:deoxyribodipyrimidine photolyase [Sandaracinus sp.]MCB9619782.1 deoxyribodipyrimidine photolyase [Sandaracinus sp.]